MSDIQTFHEVEIIVDSIKVDMSSNQTEMIEKLRLSDEKNHDKQIQILDFLAEIKQSVTEVKAQTTKTNGRVTKLETLRTAIYMCAGLATVVVSLACYIYLDNKAMTDARISRIASHIYITATTTQ